MPSSTSNFKRKLRLPRLFFANRRSREIHGVPPLDFERPIPQVPWRGMAVVVMLSLSRRRRPGSFIAARSVMVPRSTTTRISGRWHAGAFNLSLSSSSAIRAAGSISISMSCKKALANVRCNSQVRAVALIRCWPISRMTRLFTAPLFAVSRRACSWRHLALLRWSARKKMSGDLTRKRPRNAPANIWRCRWKNMSHFSNNKISRLRSF